MYPHIETVDENHWIVKKIVDLTHESSILEYIIQNYSRDKSSTSFTEIKNALSLHDEQVRRSLNRLESFDIITKNGKVSPTSFGLKCYSVINVDPIHQEIVQRALSEPFQSMVDSCLNNFYSEMRRDFLEYDQVPIGFNDQYYSQPIDSEFWPILVIFLVKTGIMPDDRHFIEAYVQHWLTEWDSFPEYNVLFSMSMPMINKAFITVLRDEEEGFWFNYNIRVSTSLILLREYCLRQGISTGIDWDHVLTIVESFNDMITEQLFVDVFYGAMMIPYNPLDIEYVFNCLTEPWLRIHFLAQLLKDLKEKYRSCSKCGYFNDDTWCDIPIIPSNISQERRNEIRSNIYPDSPIEDGGIPIRQYFGLNIPERCFVSGLLSPSWVASILSSIQNVLSIFKENFKTISYELLSSYTRYLIHSPQNYERIYGQITPFSDFFDNYLWGSPEIIKALDLSEEFPQRISDLHDQIDEVKDYYFEKIQEKYIETMDSNGTAVEYYHWMDSLSFIGSLETSIKVVEVLLNNKKIVTPRIKINDDN